ncbi:DUF427 domain-containing protein [Consotaella aegiceratis]|uniref:DUF427 domain-containing protein n=1 Tax=Consotaella aegiceratis TaxID=3097961 RepID=UPI002F42F9DE
MSSLHGESDRITIHPQPQRVEVDFHGTMIAATTAALILEERGHDPVLYIPRGDVRMELFTPTDRRTTCPWKGEARYWSVGAGGHVAENAAWSYETPLAGVGQIAGHLAFYPDTVTIRVGDQT